MFQKHSQEIVGSESTALWFDCDLLDEEIYYGNARD